MSSSHNSNKRDAASGDARYGAGQQDTVMLSDVPDAAMLVPPPSATETQATNLNLSTAVLAALGQRYDILAEAGHGSMGNVYKARDRETGETVALKLLKPEIASDQAVMERFKNELLFARKITHKNICRVYEFNRVAGVAYTSMEFVDGESLRSVLNRFGGLPLRKTFDLSLQMCSGLKEAHAQGIVHRDLKPENVMIDAQGNLKIMDFGIARSMESVTRLTGAMVGTPAYMAPEQVGGKPVDYRTDIYSLGLMLYEMFTGEPAFVADSPIAVAMKQLRESPAAPRNVEPLVPVEIERVILKCLEKDPARRFQSIAELEQALSNALNGGASVASAATAGVGTSVRGSGARGRANGGAVQGMQETRNSSVSIPLKPAKRMPVFAWISIAAAAVLVTLAGLHNLEMVKASKLIVPPGAPSAPEPPEFALEKSIPEKEPDRVPGMEKAVTPTPMPAAEAATHESSSPATPSHTSLAAELTKPKKSVAQPEQPNQPPQPAPKAAAAPEPVELPGRKSVSPPTHDAKGWKAEAAQANAAQDALSYVWVGRFSRRDKAQEAAKKIEDLRLPVVIIPRQLPAGEAFAVFTGPYNEKKSGAVVGQMRSVGFLGAHKVANPLTSQSAKK